MVIVQPRIARKLPIPLSHETIPMPRNHPPSKLSTTDMFSSTFTHISLPSSFPFGIFPLNSKKAPFHVLCQLHLKKNWIVKSRKIPCVQGPKKSNNNQLQIDPRANKDGYKESMYGKETSPERT